MDTAAQVLLIIVSSVLAVFLIILGVALIFFIRILSHIKKITKRAGNVADSVESAANAFEKAAGPMAILKMISNIVNRAQHGPTSERKNDGKK